MRIMQGAVVAAFLLAGSSVFYYFVIHLPQLDEKREAYARLEQQRKQSDTKPTEHWIIWRHNIIIGPRDSGEWLDPDGVLPSQESCEMAIEQRQRDGRVRDFQRNGVSWTTSFECYPSTFDPRKPK